MSIESDDDLHALQRIGALVARALDAMAAALAAGRTTAEIDAVGADLLGREGAASAPRRVYGFPGFNLISVNDEIVHGVPGTRRLRAGDLVKLDVTAELDGYIADAARTIALAPVSPVAERLRATARRAFEDALSQVRPGAPVSAIGRAVERTVQAGGFAVVRPLAGHGVGRTIHEAPSVPNYFDPRQTDVLTEGLVLTIEPIITERPCRIVAAADGWTLRAANGALAAHFEDTIVVTADGPRVLTRAA